MSRRTRSSQPSLTCPRSWRTARAAATTTRPHLNAPSTSPWPTGGSPASDWSPSAGWRRRSARFAAMPDQALLDDLRLAHVLADQADSITMARFKSSDLRVTAKPDLTPVTDADTAVED